MIQTILNSLKTDITGMAWVDRYAALAIPVSRTISIKSDAGYNEGNTETFPVASDVELNRCWESGTYKDLVPNSTYKSVIYWEDLTGLQERSVRRMSGNRNIYTYEATVRLVCWLSMKKLGYDTSEGTSDFVLDTIRTIQMINIDPGALPGVRLARIRVTDTMRRDHRLIFGQYSYGNQSDLFVYPYDFFAINMKLTVEMSQKCSPALEARAAINC